TACSCPDWSNPCKHIAAVYYLLGEEFDRDPFLIFRLRGLDRDELVRRLDRAAATAPVPTPAAGAAEGGPPAALSPEPSEFWRGRQPLGEALAPAYRDASALGLDVFLGEAVRVGERVKS